MTEITIVLNQEQYLRSWQTAGTLKKLLNSGIRINLICPETLVANICPHPNLKVIGLEFTSTIFEYWIDRLFWMQSLGRSSDFRLKFRRFYLSDELWMRRDLRIPDRTANFIRKAWQFLGRVLKNPLGLLGLLAGQPIRSALIFFLSVLNNRTRRGHWIRLPKTRITIVASHAQEPWLSFFIKKIRKDKGISLVVLDNWDNLTAKICFLVLPDYVSVYGDSSKSRAMELHGFSENQILVLGAPRFSLFFDKTLEGKPKDKNGSAVYVGYFQKHDELSRLEELNSLIEKIPQLKSLKWSYRPHPATALQSVDWLDNLPKHFELEPAVSNFVAHLPDLDKEYRLQLEEYDLFIGPPSSLILEAAFLGKSVIVDLTQDLKFRTSIGRTKFQIAHIADFLLLSQPATYQNTEELSGWLRHWTEGGSLKVDVSGIVRKDEPFSSALRDWLLLEIGKG